MQDLEKRITVTCGNTSEAGLRQMFTVNFQEALRLLNSGDELVEIGGLQT